MAKCSAYILCVFVAIFEEPTPILVLYVVKLQNVFHRVYVNQMPNDNSYLFSI